MSDAKNGQFEIALQKHRWYHDHAIEHEPGQYGVRLSFALTFWHQLAKVHPPAMAELTATRDKAAENARAGIDVRESFNDAHAINRVLDETSQSLDLFMHLHNADSEYARTVFPLAQSVLITHGEYDICNQYLEADETIDQMIELFRLHRDNSTSG